MKGKTILIILLICVFALFITSNETYTAYESSVENEVPIEIATWRIDIDGKDVVSATEKIAVGQITWTNEHANNKTAAPGSVGVARINIDPSKSDVAIQYEITYEDNSINPDCILSITSIYIENQQLERANDNSFEGIITMDDIKNKKIITLVINVEWVNNEENNERDTLIGSGETEADFLNLQFNARQYLGE